MKSILVFQNEIRGYRKPVFNRLAEYFEVVVLHCGRPTVTGDDAYKEIIVSKKKVWRFHILRDSPLNKIIYNFDVVISMFDLSWPDYLWPIFWRDRPRFILWGHWYSTNRIANYVRDYLMRRADVLLMYGSQEVDRMVKSGINSNRIVVAPNTIDIPNSQDFSSSTKRSFIFIGRLQGERRRNSKRADLLIRSFARLQGIIEDDIVIDIVGTGEEEDELKRLALDLGVEQKVIFHGHLEDEMLLGKLFEKAIALVSPGHVGLSVLQSFGYGVPVVTGKAVKYRKETQHLKNLLTGDKVIMGPEFYNIRHEENGLLVSTQSELDHSLAELSQNRASAAGLGKAAFQMYSQERSISRMVDGFRRAVEG